MTIRNPIFPVIHSPALGPLTGRGGGAVPTGPLEYHPSTSSLSGSEVTFTDWDNVEIAAGVGNNYVAAISTFNAFIEAGATLTVSIDIYSGTHNTPVLSLNSVDNGSESVNFTNTSGTLWVAEATIPSSGFSSASVNLVSNDASNPIVCSKFAFKTTLVSPSYDEKAILQAWHNSGRAEGVGNIWPANKSVLPVTAGDSSERTGYVVGLTVDSGEEVFAMCYIEDADGGPGNVDRCYVNATALHGGGSAELAYLDPVAGFPGYYAKRIIFDTLAYPSAYCSIFVDNAQTIAAYTQKNVEIKAIQFFRVPPSDFATDPDDLSFDDPNEIVAQVRDGLINVFNPTFTSAGKYYMGWQIRDFDTTGHMYGGGAGSVLEDFFKCQRTGDNAFKPLYEGSDSGLNGFAIKKDDSVDDFVGADVHGGQARRASPQLLIDDVAVTVGESEDYTCEKVELREFYELYSPVDGTTVFAHVDVTMIWEGNIFKVKNSITYQSNEDIIVDYMFMLSPSLYWDAASANGFVWNTITMPDQSDATYTPGAGVNATYPGEQRFHMTGGQNLNWKVEAQGTLASSFRRWVQASGSSRKDYMAVEAIADSSGLAGEQGMYASVTSSQTNDLEVWTTVTDAA